VLVGWSTQDRPLLDRLVGDPAMMVHLGGAESPEKIAQRQSRYEQPGSGQYKILDEETGEGVGWVGYWDRTIHSDEVFEVGWAVVPEQQGRGHASVATAELLALLRAERRRQFVHAYPSVENPASNAICRKLGFTLLGAHDFEYPPASGSVLRCNDWRLDLHMPWPS
jgi:RimJ/RimL family protein N-acetyltransferase